MSTNQRIYLSPPHMGGRELEYVQEAFASNWLAPLGPHVDGFESEFAQCVGAEHAVALSSGTAALHLALRHIGVGPGDDVAVSDLTFCASVNPILYEGARPVFIDAELTSWNLDPDLVQQLFESRRKAGKPIKALIVVHLYGQSADMTRLVELCKDYQVELIEDAAEALGATHEGRPLGALGRAGVFSFNGNKIITTSGGGMLVTNDSELAEHARKLATQARDPAPHYEHSEVGFNYRMSNVLAGMGRGQLEVLPKRVERRRAIFARYVAELGGLEGIDFMPEASWGSHTRWLTCATLDPLRFGAHRDEIISTLAADNVEARPLWKPMHLQPIYASYECLGGERARSLFENGLCLPSGSSLTEDEQSRVIEGVLSLVQR